MPLPHYCVIDDLPSDSPAVQTNTLAPKYKCCLIMNTDKHVSLPRMLHARQHFFFNNPRTKKKAVLCSSEGTTSHVIVYSLLQLPAGCSTQTHSLLSLHISLLAFPVCRHPCKHSVFWFKVSILQCCMWLSHRCTACVLN